MSHLANAKSKAARGNIKEAFCNEEGAIDLASIMVGIIVIGLVGGVIAATVFAVVPWAQDNAARQQLDNVGSAQNAYLGLRANETKGSATEAVRFGLKAGLVNEKLLPDLTPVAIGVPLLDKDGPGTFNPLTDPDGAGPLDPLIENAATGKDTHYVAISKSATGKFFWSTDSRKAGPSAVSLAAAKTAAEATVTAPTSPATFVWSYDGSL
jgi:type II secretory pathway pseudopilin PulG